MIYKKTIDASEIERILTIEEGQYIDLKGKDISPAKLSKSISAFANTSGGELFIGISEATAGDSKSRTWNAFKDIEETNAIFQVLEKMISMSTFYKVSHVYADKMQGCILHILIIKTKDIILATDGKPYVRRAAQNLPVEDIRRLELDKGIISFEDNTVDTPLVGITNSSTVLDFLINVVPSAEPEEWLLKQNLINNAKPTVSGLLLFSDEPQTSLPKRSAIKIYRYKTKESEGSRETLVFDPITIEGCVYSLIREAVAKTKELIEGISKLATTGLMKVQYPHETLHEIITNAVLHRDYSITADVHVRIYDNRVEVESPGKLPGHVTLENILREQSARNPKMVRLINKFPDPPNKDVGEGLNTAFEAMKKLSLKEPEIEEREHSVVIHIRHTPLASPYDIVVEYLASNSEITNRIARELTGIGSENAVKRIFLDLKKRKILEPVPNKKGGASAWRIYTGYWEDDSKKDQLTMLLDMEDNQ